MEDCFKRRVNIFSGFKRLQDSKPLQDSKLRCEIDVKFSKFYEPEMGRELKFLLILGFFGISIFGHFRPARMVGVE